MSWLADGMHYRSPALLRLKRISCQLCDRHFFDVFSECYKSSPLAHSVRGQNADRAEDTARRVRRLMAEAGIELANADEGLLYRPPRERRGANASLGPVPGVTHRGAEEK